MDGDPTIDDEVGAHTRVTVLAYWKFESVSLQQRVERTPFPLKGWRAIVPRLIDSRGNGAPALIQMQSTA